MNSSPLRYKLDHSSKSRRDKGCKRNKQSRTKSGLRKLNVSLKGKIKALKD